MKWITVVIFRSSPLLSTVANIIPTDGAAKGKTDETVKGTAAGAAKGTTNEANNTATWDKLQINSTQLCAMPYGNFRVPIHGHVNNSKSTTNQKRYFYKPIALLDHRSAISDFNGVTQENEMRFKIHMWNEEVEKKVTQHVSKVVGENVQPHQVQVMDLEKVMLTNGSENSPKYSLKKDWMFINNQKTMEFFVSCFEKSDCDQLADTMRTSPELFHNFQLLFSCQSLETQTRETVIRIDSIVKGGMVASLLQQERFKGKDEVLLTAKDLKKLLAESTTRIIVEASDDTPNGFPPDFEAQITEKLKGLLVITEARIEKSSSLMWESVFWNDDNYRPDKAAKMMNEVYKKSDKDQQKKLVESFKNSNKVVASGGADNSMLGQVKLDTDFGRESNKSSDDLNKLVQESKDHIEWNGEKFTPKPLSLSRISLSKLRDKQFLQDKRVRLLNSTVLLSTNINYDNEGKDEKRLFDLMSRNSSSVKEIEALVMSGVNINCRNNREMTPLLQLLEVSHPNTKDILLLLIKNKVNFNAKDNEGRTALHVLCKNYTNNDVRDIAQILIRHGVDVTAKDIYGQNALHLLLWYSKNNNVIEIVRLLIGHGVDIKAKANNGCTALLLLCRHYQNNNLKEIIELLIANKVDVNAKFDDGWTALMLLCRHYQNNNLKEIVELLIKNKVDINAKNDDGWTALHFLCGKYQNNNLKEIIELLIANKVDINAKNNNGWYALTLLCEFYKNENLIDIIRIFIQHGVDVNAKDSDGFTAADYIRKKYDKSNKNDILKLLADGK